MSLELVNAVKDTFTGDLISKASSFLGENEGGITKAISGLVPSLIAGVANKANESTDGAQSVFSMANQVSSSGILGNLGSVFSDGGSLLNQGGDMARSIFGGNTSSIINAIASYAGLKNSSATSLMSLAAPVVLGQIGKMVADKNLSASGLASWLSEQKSSLLSVLPSGLGSIAGLLGLGKVAETFREPIREAYIPPTTEPSYTYSAERAKPGGTKLWPLLLLALGALLLWFFWRSCNRKPSEVPVTDTVMQDTVQREDSMPAVVREPVTVTVPGGVAIQGYKGGIEDQLGNYLNDPNAVLDKDKWFDFDNINFKFGTAELTEESQGQLDNVVAILKAYPKVKIKLGGYTDKVGDETANMKLSQERADAVKAALEAKGVGNQVVGAEGYGSQFAKYPADAPESDRIHDRRIAISVREK